MRMIFLLGIQGVDTTGDGESDHVGLDTTGDGEVDHVLVCISKVKPG